MYEVAEKEREKYKRAWAKTEQDLMSISFQPSMWIVPTEPSPRPFRRITRRFSNGEV